MPPVEPNAAPEVTVVGPAYWADHAVELSGFLRAAKQGTKRVIADPSGNPSALMAAVFDPAYWSGQPQEVADAMRRGASDLANAPVAGMPKGDSLAAGASEGQDRLTLTVEEAATALGISRALAYEAVEHGDIPSIRIGRRILVPRSRLLRMLDAAEEATPTDNDVGRPENTPG